MSTATVISLLCTVVFMVLGIAAIFLFVFQPPRPHRSPPLFCGECGKALEPNAKVVKFSTTTGDPDMMVEFRCDGTPRPEPVGGIPWLMWYPKVHVVWRKKLGLWWRK